MFSQRDACLANGMSSNPWGVGLAFGLLSIPLGCELTDLRPRLCRRTRPRRRPSSSAGALVESGPVLVVQTSGEFVASRSKTPSLSKDPVPIEGPRPPPGFLLNPGPFHSGGVASLGSRWGDPTRTRDGWPPLSLCSSLSPLFSPVFSLSVYIYTCMYMCVPI